MEVHQKPTRFLLMSILPQSLPDSEALLELREVKSLVETYGGIVCDLVVQRRELHDKGLYLGRGKLDQAKHVIKDQQIDVVVVNGLVKPGHIFAIKTILRDANAAIEVWDRIDLILQIFALHAHTAEAKLQIELAQMRHMGPRIYGMGYVMSRQGGGIGTLGVGETNTELMKRHWRDQMKKVQDRIQKHTADRERQLLRRCRNGLQTLSLMGYTNAGKTSLFNLLTGKKNSVQNALFVTLDSSTGKIFLPLTKKEALLTDTIGFIQNLPPHLIDAFRSTLMESLYADLLLIVIDASDPDLVRKISVVEQILGSLRMQDKSRIYVFNKADKLTEKQKKEIAERYTYYHPFFVSVQTKSGITSLLEEIESQLNTAYPVDKEISLDRPRKRVYFTD